MSWLSNPVVVTDPAIDLVIETVAKPSPFAQIGKGELKGVLDADRALLANCAALSRPLWMDVTSAKAPAFAGMT